MHSGSLALKQNSSLLDESIAEHSVTGFSLDQQYLDILQINVKLARNTEPMPTITQLQRERLLRVVEVIKLPFSVRMLMITAALLLMEEYIERD